MLLSRISLVLLITLLGLATLKAQTNNQWTEDPIWVVQFVYSGTETAGVCLKKQDTSWKKVAEAAKNQGIILDYLLVPAGYSAKSESYLDLMLMMKVNGNTDLNNLEKKIKDISERFAGITAAQKQLQFPEIDIRSLFRQVGAQ